MLGTAVFPSPMLIRSHLRYVLLAVFLTSGMVRAVAENYALVIGVNECPEFRLPSGRRPLPLRGAEFDADRVAKLLTERYSYPSENVVFLRGQSASLERVEVAIAELTQRVHRGDRFSFYFSGHGTQVEDIKPFDEQVDGVDEALCLYDAKSDGSGLLRDDQLGAFLDGLAASSITVALDCCHAGTGIKEASDEYTAKSLPILASQINRRPSDQPWVDLGGSSKSLDKRITVYYACRPEQQAYECRVPLGDQLTRAGQFTHYLLEALAKKRDAKLGVVGPTAEEIHAAVLQQIEVRFNSTRKLEIDQQHPNLQTDRRGGNLFQ